MITGTGRLRPQPAAHLEAVDTSAASGRARRGRASTIGCRSSASAPSPTASTTMPSRCEVPLDDLAYGRDRPRRPARGVRRRAQRRRRRAHLSPRGPYRQLDCDRARGLEARASERCGAPSSAERPTSPRARTGRTAARSVRPRPSTSPLRSANTIAASAPPTSSQTRRSRSRASATATAGPSASAAAARSANAK